MANVWSILFVSYFPAHPLAVSKETAHVGLKLAHLWAGFYHQTSIAWFPCSSVGTHMVCIPTLERGNERNLWERLSSRDRRGWKATST